MKNRHKTNPAEATPPVRYGSALSVGVPFRNVHETSFERLKTRLLTQSLAERTDPELNTPLRRAANEAASLAWTTAFPSLFFPALFEEIAVDAARHAVRQREIRWTSPRFSTLAE